MNATKWLAPWCCVSIVVVGFGGGCGGQNAQSASSASSNAKPQAQPSDGPPAIFIGPTGTRFKLVGRANVRAVGPDYAEQYSKREDLRAQTADKAAARPADPTVSPSLEELAEDLRPVTMINGYEYVGEEPAYALAESVLRGDTGDQSTEGREGRSLIGPPCSGGATGTHCDDRVIAPNPTGIFNSPNLFSEVGCTATMIDRGTAVTAAHCMFNPSGWFTDNPPNSVPYWLVVDGNSCLPSSESNGVNTEDRRNATLFSTTTDNCLPRWAGGMSASGAPWGWNGCYNVTITSAWRNGMTESGGQIRWDFAVINFYQPGLCPFPNPGDTTGWRGTLIATQTQFANNYNYLVGYPGVADPGGSSENAFDNSLRRWTPVADCGGYNDANGGNAAHSIKPCVTAQMIGMSATAGYSINPWGHGTWELGSTLIDASGGQSGAGIFLTVTNPTGTKTAPSASGAFYLVGIHHGHEIEGTQVARAWDTELKNFVTSNSSFPRLN